MERAHGAAADLFRRPWPEPAARSVWVVEPDDTAVVLGSTQLDSVVVPGMPFVRRRSGGGAVLVEPGAPVWVDVFVPAGDPLWEADVGRAFAWFGEAWRQALTAAGIVGACVHTGPLVSAPWSDLVCFAGVGPGEVTVEGAKVVGMAQRRARTGALFQSAALLDWSPARLLDRLALTDDERRRGARELAGVARPVAADADVLVAALLDRLP